MTARWTTNKTCVFNLGFHLIWCPKYRRKVLQGEVASRLIALLKEKTSQLDVNLVSLEVMEDHVHLFVKLKPNQPIHWLVSQLKGYTSRILRQEYPSLKSRLPTLWTRSYFAESVGVITQESVVRYIENQKRK